MYVQTYMAVRTTKDMNYCLGLFSVAYKYSVVMAMVVAG